MAALEKAEAEKVQVVKAAEADSEAKYLQGQGIARQRQVQPAACTGLCCFGRDAWGWTWSF